MKLNKAAAGDTASLLFQSGWSGRAEIGLAGSDDVTLKVSADGSAFFTALQAAAATGRITLPGGLTVNGTVAGSAVQSDGSDTTAGRLVRLAERSGVFGLGLPDTTLAVPPGDNLTTLRVSGLYRFSSGTVGKPAATAGVVLHAVRLAGTGAATHLQLALTTSAATPLMLRRINSDGSWTAWSSGLFQENLLGAVSQSAGVPTGAVIERGANANGDYVRFADGTQICTLTAAVNLAISVAFQGGFRSAGQSWTYPAAFIAAPSLCVHALAATAFGGMSHNAGTISTGGWAVTAITSQTAADRTVSLMAIGRWF